MKSRTELGVNVQYRPVKRAHAKQTALHTITCASVLGSKSAFAKDAEASGTELSPESRENVSHKDLGLCSEAGSQFVHLRSAISSARALLSH